MFALSCLRSLRIYATVPTMSRTLKEVIEEAGGVSEAEKLLGVNASTVYRWIAGSVKPRPLHWAAMVRAGFLSNKEAIDLMAVGGDEDVPSASGTDG